ncbi:hypothetical protein ACA910_008233 [Epithemia clementina (nom. ined.)]
MNVAKNTLRPLTRFFESGVEECSDSSDSAFQVFEDEQLYEKDSGSKFATREDRRVIVWRSLVLLMLLGAGATTSVFTYYVLNNEQDEDFEVSYGLLVLNVEEAGAASVTKTQRVFQALSESITAAAITNNETFPFVTIPGFELHAGYARRVSGIEMISFTPIVQDYELDDWTKYASEHQGWLQESREMVTHGDELLLMTSYKQEVISPIVYQFDDSLSPVPATTAPFAPIWQTSPPPFDAGFINYNIMAEFFVQRMYQVAQETRTGWLTEVMDLSQLGMIAINNADHETFHQRFRNPNDPMNASSAFLDPHCVYSYPVFEKLADTNSPLVGLILGLLPWDYYLLNLLPDGAGAIYAVLENSRNQSFTYIMNGTSAIYLGPGDQHDQKYDYMMRQLDFAWPSGLPESVGSQVAFYRYRFYPTGELSDRYRTSLPVVMAVVVAAIFLAVALTFFMYDRFVRSRNVKVVNAAVRSNRIVSSLFPSNVRDRLLAEQEENEKIEAEQQGTQTRLKKFLATDSPTSRDMETENIMFKTQPIADLFPETTIMFADIAGFTAWSSAREPSQVFTLLETVFKAFDEIAKRRRVFKVETVGDCYVAATGLPEPRQDHAVAMARFAKDCMTKMQVLTRKLEVHLGPDTADLSMRMGIHSGPVTAGVLRGERSRFQLFGDTMNTASRMESTGMRDKIQVSQETADYLVAAGKKSWITPREDIVTPKGKGEMRTYWLEVGKGKEAATELTPNTRSSTRSISVELSVSSDDVTEGDDDEEEGQFSASAKIARLIDWNVDVLLRLLKAIVAHRQAHGQVKGETRVVEDFSRGVGKTILDEVEERIALPEFDPSVAKRQLPPEQIELDSSAQTQLYEYVAAIAAMYRDNPFHNFEHASHVAMSVSKLLARIIAPPDLDFQSSDAKNRCLHDHTYGITSDPLTQFACVLSALIHDVDHTGVPNTQLVKENAAIAKYYKGRSVAEQNSVDVAWDLLLENTYKTLRRTIYTTNEEMQRFRKLVVNSVMATDIMDKELKDKRNARWDLAFSEKATDDPLATVQRKATIVIEHLIQASDVAHTMQHWHIYQKWNGRLFEEMYKAYKEGRAEKNPAEFWYKGEIGFFDFYIIPLAKKLKDCGVFGVSSDEYLNYAEHNRKEWEARGLQVVGELVERVKNTYDVQESTPPSTLRSPHDMEVTITTVIS